MSEDKPQDRQNESTSEESRLNDQTEKPELKMNDDSSTPEDLLKKKKFKNGILTLIGTLILKLGIYSPAIIMNLNTYFMSYLRSFQPEGKKTLTFEHAYFISPITVVSAMISVPFVGIIEKKAGLKLTIFIGIIFGILAVFILIVSHNYFLDLFAFVLFAFLLSFSSVVSGKNLSMYFFSKRGTINGILSLLTNLSCAGFNFIGEYIINPGSAEVEKDKYYSPEISKNVINLFWFVLIIIGVCYFISLFLIIPYDIKTFGDPWEEFKKEEKEKKEAKEKMNIDSIDDSLLPEEEDFGKEQIIDSSNAEELESTKNKNDEKNTKEEIKDENNETKEDKKKEEQKKQRTKKMKKVLKSFRLWRLFLINALKIPASTLILSTWRPIALKKEIDTKFCQSLGTYIFISTSISTPLFGFLADKIQFRILICIVSIVVSLSAFFFFNSYRYKNLLCILVMLIQFVDSGEAQTGSPHFMKVFGLEYYIEVLGVIGLSSIFLSPLCSFLAFYIGVIEDEKKRDLGLKIMYITGGGLSIISIILTVFETEEPFNYEN